MFPIVLKDAANFVGEDKQDFLDMIQEILKSLHPLAYRKDFTLPEIKHTKVSIRLGEAGHILGSAWCLVSGPEKVLFSGDLGAPYTPLLPVYVKIVEA